MGINYMGMIPVLIKAIQEQQITIQSLQNRVATLEHVIEQMRQETRNQR